MCDIDMNRPVTLSSINLENEGDASEIHQTSCLIWGLFTLSPLKFIIMPMETDRLMGTEPILPVKRSVSINTM